MGGGEGKCFFFYYEKVHIIHNFIVFFFVVVVVTVGLGQGLVLVEGVGVVHVDVIVLVQGLGVVLVPGPGLVVVLVPSLQSAPVPRKEIGLVPTQRSATGRRASLVAIAAQSLLNVPGPGLDLGPVPVLVVGRRNVKGTILPLSMSQKRMAPHHTMMSVVHGPDPQLLKRAPRPRIVTCVHVVLLLQRTVTMNECYVPLHILSGFSTTNNRAETLSVCLSYVCFSALQTLCTHTLFVFFFPFARRCIVLCVSLDENAYLRSSLIIFFF